MRLCLASAPSWPATQQSRDFCRLGAEIAELLATSDATDATHAWHANLRAAILYELAELPAIAAALFSETRSRQLQDILGDLFSRRSGFGRTDTLIESQVAGYAEVDDFAALAMAADSEILLRFEHSNQPALPKQLPSEVAAKIATELDIGLGADEARGFGCAIRVRAARALRIHVDGELWSVLHELPSPPELYATQVEALQQGLLDQNIDAWGLASPTGTGKTFVTRLLILDLLRVDDTAKVLYVVPSRALVAEVAKELGSLLRPRGHGVIAMSAQLVALDPYEDDAVREARVIVLTPEKADMLLRLGHDAISNVSLVVVDEAHHIEAGTRGVLLEFYLWRLRRLMTRTRFVFLSAVAPNIDEITAWIGKRHHAVVLDRRSTRMRSGVYKIQGTRRNKVGIIEYADGTRLTVIKNGVASGVRKALTQLVEAIAPIGPVLVVAKGKRECETLANLMVERLSSANRPSHSIRDHVELLRLDSRLEREMYSDVPMRRMLPFGVAYHHAGLPPRVRQSVEAAIRAGLIKFVFATTTLAEGVNFPFSSVIVQSLTLREAPQQGRPARFHPVTPRTFWNIAGRAGRPGHDREGQAILFEPSLGTERVGIVLAPYLDPELHGIDPVKSAFAAGLDEIAQGVRRGDFDLQDLSDAVLAPELPREVQGAVNLFRIGIVHARAAQISFSPEEILDGSFAATMLSPETRAIALRFARLQGKVVEDYLRSDGAVSVDTIARLGLSIQTVTALRDYVVGLSTIELEGVRHLFRGGALNLRAAPRIIGAVTRRMAELEGTVLGAFYDDVIRQWIAGVPFSRITARSSRLNRIEDIISVVYSRVQYLLPWGLYATDELLVTETGRRQLDYGNEVARLAYLVDAGVPSYDALRLVQAGFERVDATRIAAAYIGRGGLRTGVDVLAWVSHQTVDDLSAWIAGPDNRPVDLDLDEVLDGLRNAVAQT